MWLFKNMPRDEVGQFLWFPAHLSFILKAINAAFVRYVLPLLSPNIILPTPVENFPHIGFDL